MQCNRAPGTGNAIPGPFTNWAENVTADPQQICQPTTLDQLVAIIKQAEAANLSVKAVGSGWSFTDIMVSPDYMVDTCKLNNILSETVTGQSYGDPVFSALTPAAKRRLLFHVQAGIKLYELHDTLETNPNYRPAAGQNPPPGVVLNDGPGGSPQPHGYALKTLGGSGGQSIVGAASTSVHGGDDHDAKRTPIQPLPDMIQGIYLVAAGGAEFFVQRGGPRAIVDPTLLAQLEPCLAGRIISNDTIFNSVVVSMGRMGIIYSVVIEVRQQYVLFENRSQSTWTNGTIPILATLRSNRFLQVLILPYANSDSDHTCFITTRNEVQPDGPPSNPSGFDPFTFACDAAGPALSGIVAGTIAGLATAVGALIVIPIIGPILAAPLILLITVLNPLLDPSITFDACLAAAVDLVVQCGRMDLAQWLVNTILSLAQSPQTRQDLSYKIMDTYDYQSKCREDLSLEVAFDADGAAYFDFLNAVFQRIDEFAAQNILYGGYISLRYCAGSSALLAIEQWPHTVCIEFGALGGLANEMDVLDAFEQEAANRGGVVHWGQLNTRSRADVEAAFPRKIDRWRATLARVSKNGSLNTFDNEFCVNRGLEVDNERQTGPDLSYLVPLLLDTSS
jgi:hypothetical protein